jgi:lipoprotein-anchoring transpeptidase ErfK/SrfK
MKSPARYFLVLALAVVVAAVIVWRQRREGPPETRARSHYLLAQAAEASGNAERAQALWAEHIRDYPDSPEKGEALLGLGRLLLAAGDEAGAREQLAAGIRSVPAGPRAKKAREDLGALNRKAFFAGEAEGWTEEHTVVSGDTISSIATRFHATAALVSAMNGLKDAVIREGQTLRVPARRFEVLVSKSANTATLLYGGEFFKVYPAGTGKQSCTPAGTFTIATKLVDPPWYTDEGVIPPDDPRNVLGARWMGFNDPYAHYGIHGTVEPDSVGTQSSEGCVRLLNEDVAELYDFLPYGTTVTVIE